MQVVKLYMCTFKIHVLLKISYYVVLISFFFHKILIELDTNITISKYISKLCKMS